VPPPELRLISWPFHNGLHGVGMGAGAARLAGDEELVAGLAAAGWSVRPAEVPPVDESGSEIARVLELVRRLAGVVRGAVDEGAFPLVLAGNCNSSLGTVAGAGDGDLGVVWFDAHADFDDPEENTSGFFDVMGLAMLTGRGWRGLRETIPGHRPVPEPDVVLAAVRDLEPYQRARVEGSALRVAPGAIDPARFESALDGLAAKRVYLHVDLDSLDSSEASANGYAAPGGPSLERLLECIRLTCERYSVAAAAITSYDPAFDHDRRALAAARRVAVAIAEGARG
jgi:arginase